MSEAGRRGRESEVLSEELREVCATVRDHYWNGKSHARATTKTHAGSQRGRLFLNKKRPDISDWIKKLVSLLILILVIHDMTLSEIKAFILHKIISLNKLLY